MNTTEQEVKDACSELEKAMLNAIEARKNATDAELLRISAHKRLCLARDVIHTIRFS